MNSDQYRRHGGPYDRGGADSYYGRGFEPHYYEAGTYSSRRIERNEMTEKQIAEYRAGYEDNEQTGGKKDWGDHYTTEEKEECMQ